jgi:hypothetical protein
METTILRKVCPLPPAPVLTELPPKREKSKVPKSKVVSDKWFVRVNGEESFLRQKCGELQQWATTVLIHAVFHMGSTREKPHVHIIHSLDKSLQNQSYSLKIKELFNTSGTGYSATEWDGKYEGAGSYLYHEAHDDGDYALAPVLCSKGITELHVNQMIEYSKVIKKLVEEKKKKASHTIVERCLEHFEEGDKPTARTIWEYIFYLIRNGDVYNPGQHHLTKYAAEVLQKRGSDSAWNSYRDAMFDRAFPEPKDYYRG